MKTYETYEAAYGAAKTPATTETPTTNADPYAIPVEMAESANALVGKTLRSRNPQNKNTLMVMEWVGQNYVIKVNGASYTVNPVMWILQNLNKMIVD